MQVCVKKKGKKVSIPAGMRQKECMQMIASVLRLPPEKSAQTLIEVYLNSLSRKMLRSDIFR
jgi:hypothetical protein